MGKVRIVTDSTADIPIEIAERMGIVVIPLKVHFGTNVFRDGIDITTEEFITRIRAESHLPTTSQPSPGEFVAVYEKMISQGEQIISIHLSSHLSGTFQSARTAKAIVDSKDIYVVDSKSASLGLGLIILSAAKAAQEGLNLREILALVHEKIERMKLVFLVDTLEYLQRGGRIGKAGALIGSLLRIKPILGLEDGQVIPLERVRGEAKAMERLVEIIAESTNQSKWYNCWVAYGNSKDKAVQLQANLSQVLQCESPMITRIGSVIMSHVGPELIGVAVCPE